MQLNPAQFIGLTGVPLIESIVEYLKDNFRLSGYLAPLAALLVGVVLNESLAVYLHQSLLVGFYVGLFSGFSSSYWHEMSKPMPPTKPSTPSVTSQ